MNITATDIPALQEGLDDYNHRIGPEVKYVLRSNVLVVGHKIPIHNVEKYLRYCEGLGATVVVDKSPRLNINIHINN